MPFKSKSQQRFFFGAEGRGALPKGTAKTWADHTDDFGSLPERLHPPRKGKKPVKDTVASSVAEKAAACLVVAPLAEDTGVPAATFVKLAADCGLSPNEFVRRAYVDPVGFAKVAFGDPSGGNILRLIADHMRKIGPAVQNAAATTKAHVAAHSKKYLGGAGALTGAGATVGAVNSLNKPTPAGPTEQAVQQADAINAAAKAPAPAPQPSQQTKPEPQALPGEQQGRGQAEGPASSSPGRGALFADAGIRLGRVAAVGAAGLGAGALGGAALASATSDARRKKKPQQQKVASAVETVAKTILTGALVKLAHAKRKKDNVAAFCRYLDKVASVTPVNQTPRIRVMQAEVASGKPLGSALKVAFPHLTPERRGVLAADLVRGAHAFKQAEFKPKGVKVVTTEKRETTKPHEAGKVMKAMGC